MFKITRLYLPTTLIATTLVLSAPVLSSACDPASELCQFLNSITVEFDQAHNHLLQDEPTMTSFASITRLWVNEQSLCNGDEDVYWGFLFDFDKDDEQTLDRRRRSGKGKGKCRGNNCPAQLNFSYPKRLRKNSTTSNPKIATLGTKSDPCAKTLMEALKESNPTFADLEYLSLALTNGEAYQEYCEAEDVEKCEPQRVIVEDVLTSLGANYTLGKNDHECFLEGIHCDYDLNVSSLDFRYDEMLTGSISTRIGLLGSLYYIDFSNNNLKCSLPTEIGNLARLSILSLNGNKLTGCVPTEIGNLINLRVLDLGSNKFKGTVPTEIGKLVNLTSLSLAHNRFKGRVPKEFGLLSKLSYLSMDANLCQSYSKPEYDDDYSYLSVCCYFSFWDVLLLPFSWLWWPSWLWDDFFEQVIFNTFEQVIYNILLVIILVPCLCLCCLLGSVTVG